MDAAAQYHALANVNKADVRRFLVQITFGSQLAAARRFGRTRTTVNQVVSLSRRSRPLDSLLYREIKKKHPELARLWAA